MQTKTQIDLLGKRLKTGSRTEVDLKLLDAYRRSFDGPYQEVRRVIRENVNLDTTGRPAKSTSSIIDKLLRESTRLSQIQDIAGCRIVVRNIDEQLSVDSKLMKCFSNARRVDRTQNPQYGYRAIHIIPNIDGKPIEIQLRSVLQHAWAELSEKISDKHGQELKYGGGKEYLRDFLAQLSELISDYEHLEILIQKKPQQNRTDIEKAYAEYLEKIKPLSDKIIKVINVASDKLAK